MTQNNEEEQAEDKPALIHEEIDAAVARHNVPKLPVLACRDGRSDSRQEDRGMEKEPHHGRRRI